MTNAHPVIRVIVNSGSKTMQEQSARDALEQQVEAALPGAVVRFTSDDNDIMSLVKDAMVAKPTMIVAGGGDGTINAVASAVADTDIRLGVLPLGTLNHFAKDLGIPFDIEPALAVLRDGMERAIDAAEVNGRLFVNNSGLGLYPDIVHQREARQRLGQAKWPAAIAATIRALARYRRLGVRVATPEGTVLLRTPAILIGNNEYTTEGSLEPHRDSLTEGVLSLYSPTTRGRFRLLWFSAKALMGSVKASTAFETQLMTELTIESRHANLRVSLDGEVERMATPLHYRIRPGALRVMLPNLSS